MQKREDNSEPLGICRRLFNFIMNNLVAQGLNRMITGHHPLPHHHESIEVPVEGPSTDKTEKKANSKDYPSSEIVVEFKPSNGLQHWNPVVNGKKEGITRPSHKKEILVQDGGLSDRVPKKIVSVKDKKKEKNIQQSDETPKPPHLLPFLNNINVKSDEFIRQKKEALKRVYTQGH